MEKINFVNFENAKHLSQKVHIYTAAFALPTPKNHGFCRNVPNVSLM